MKYYILLFLFLIIGCADPAFQKEDAGVVLHGYQSRGYLENNNEFPVRIRCVRFGDSGEETMFIHYLNPKERWNFDSKMCRGYHINKAIDANEEIGFIRTSN